MRFRREKKIIGSFQHAALTDIIFLLLIFFLLSSTFVFQPGIKVNLPAASKTELQAMQNVFVTLAKNGDIFVNEQKVPLYRLAQVLTLRLEKTKDKLVIFKADSQIYLENLVNAMDIARRSGAQKLAIATRVKKED